MASYQSSKLWYHLTLGLQYLCVFRNTEAVEKSVVRIKGSKFIDTGGGFLLEQNDSEETDKQVGNWQTISVLVRCISQIKINDCLQQLIIFQITVGKQ